MVYWSYDLFGSAYKSDALESLVVLSVKTQNMTSFSANYFYREKKMEISLSSFNMYFLCKWGWNLEYVHHFDIYFVLLGFSSQHN